MVVNEGLSQEVLFQLRPPGWEGTSWPTAGETTFKAVGTENLTYPRWENTGHFQCGLVNKR